MDGSSNSSLSELDARALLAPDVLNIPYLHPDPDPLRHPPSHSHNLPPQFFVPASDVMKERSAVPA